MRINFFEEYPTEENMAKLDLVAWPATVLCALPSFEEFEKIRRKYLQRYPHITFGWWPTVPDSYWVSGFSNSTSLDRLFAELTTKIEDDELPVLIDMELPRNWFMYIKNIFNISSNKKKITKFLSEAPKYNLKIYTAEYATSGRFNKFFAWAGIFPSFMLPHTKLPMCYSSMIRKPGDDNTWHKIKKYERELALAHQGRVGFGLGTIAVGVLGNEPILSAEDLAKDIEWAKSADVEEVFIFRLGGLNEAYLSIF